MSEGHIAEKPVYHVAPKEVSPAATTRLSLPVTNPPTQQGSLNMSGICLSYQRFFHCLFYKLIRRDG
jgi:hypothetical protein